MWLDIICTNGLTYLKTVQNRTLHSFVQMKTYMYLIKGPVSVTKLTCGMISFFNSLLLFYNWKVFNLSISETGPYI